MTISQATIIGRSHRLMRHNCQDYSFATALPSNIAFGLICDGCGSKYRENGRSYPSHNEIGANLLGQFAADFLTTHLTDPPEDISEVLANLHTASLAFLQNLVALFPGHNQHKFIATRLLATLVGFVHLPDTAVFFWQGDGFLAVNGRVCQLDSGNQPSYLAYQLLQSEPQQSIFQLAFVPQPDQIRWLAVTSDGWHKDLLCQLAEPRPSLALQRWLNVQAQQRGQFDDDGAVAVWYKNEEKIVD